MDYPRNRENFFFIYRMTVYLIFVTPSFIMLLEIFSPCRGG